VARAFRSSVGAVAGYLEKFDPLPELARSDAAAAGAADGD
jgi:hypothetical protein